MYIFDNFLLLPQVDFNLGTKLKWSQAKRHSIINFLPNLSLSLLIYFNLTLIILYLEPKFPRLFSKLLHVNLSLYQNLTQWTYFTTKGYSEITYLRCLKQVGHGLCRGQTFTENTKLLESEDLKREKRNIPFCCISSSFFFLLWLQLS